MCAAKGHVRFTPNSDRESGLQQKFMSALPPKADMCGATAYVCFGPKADMFQRETERPPCGGHSEFKLCLITP
jgi:hypothetical protein